MAGRVAGRLGVNNLSLSELRGPWSVVPGGFKDVDFAGKAVITTVALDLDLFTKCGLSTRDVINLDSSRKYRVEHSLIGVRVGHFAASSQWLSFLFRVVHLPPGAVLGSDIAEVDVKPENRLLPETRRRRRPLKGAKQAGRGCCRPCQGLSV